MSTATHPPTPKTVTFAKPAAAKSADTAQYTVSAPDPKRARLFPVRILSSTVTPPEPIREMPVSINNGLTCFELELGPSHSLLSIQPLLDTCAATNTGQLAFHLWVMSNYPDIVDSFEAHDGPHPFRPVDIAGAVKSSDASSSSVPTTVGSLTAVIRYKTPYRLPDGTPFLFEVSLGKDVEVNTIMGLPDIQKLSLVMDFAENVVTSHVLRIKFPMKFCAAPSGLPPGTIFDPDEFLRAHSAQTIAVVTSSAAPSAAAINPPRYSAVDDFSEGFQKRSVTRAPSPAPMPAPE
jgi:hypothetical protein